MKRIFLSIFALCCMAMAASSATKVYINPGHGSWGPNCRPMATVNYAAGDTLGFFESNTNLWKAFAMEEKLKANGFSVKLSRRASGGSGTNEWNKALSTICTEAENYGTNYYISIHSNAGPTGSDGSFAN
jgi:N-acetylmuramoyl-L-alanine amidase